MSAAPLPSLLNLPLRHTQARVTKKNLIVEASSSLEETKSTDPCRVCETRVASYTCPQCGMRTCSAACYQQHGTACVEAFSQHRVAQVLTLEARESKDDTQRMLRRVHDSDSNNQTMDRIQQSTLVGNHTDNDALFSRDDLVRLLAALEQADATSDQQQLARILQEQPGLQTAVVASLQRGELQEWLLDPWFPWWQPNYHHAVETVEESDDNPPETNDDNDDSSLLLDGKTLDEHLVAIPSFHRPFHPTLPYCLIEILHAVAWTLRLYHGLTNALEQQPCEAANTLLEVSTVLGQDARCPASAASVLTTAATTLSRNTQKPPVPLLTAARDVAAILRGGWRSVARALLEATSLLRAAKKQSKGQKDHDDDELLQKEAVTKTTCLKLALTKLAFYLSWTKSHGHVFSELAQEVEAHVRECASLYDEEGELHSLKLPVVAPSPQSNTTDSAFLIKEVSEKRIRKTVNRDESI